MANIDGVEHAKKLWILEQVVAAGSFRGAAVRAKVSTPAISQALSSLERIAGKPLVVRKAGRIQPTDAATELLAAAAPAIRILSELTLGTGSADLPAISWISFGAYESLAIDLLPRLTVALRQKLPKLKLTVRIADNRTLATMVRQGELCAAIVDETDDFGRLAATRVGEDRLGFYVSAAVPETQRRWEFVTRQPVGLLSPGPDGYPRFYRKFIQMALGAAFRPTVLSDGYEALRASAAFGSIVALLPTRIAARAPAELAEVESPASHDSASGRHGIFLISQPNCDADEIRFLTNEIRPLLGHSLSRATDVDH